MALLENGAW